MASKIQRELAFLLTGRDVSASKAMTNLNRKITRLERHSGKAFSNISRNMERGLVIGAGAAVGAIGYAVNEALNWESAFAGVRKTVEGTPEQIAAIEQGIRDLSKVMPTSAVELAMIAESAGALGIARKDILSFTRVVAMIGATTNVSSEDAATALGQLQNVLGLTGADFNSFAAALVDLGNKGASTEAQILEIARRSGGAAKLVGVAKDETLGWAAAAANLGMQDEIAGTSLQRFFQIVQTNVGSGGKKLDALAKTAGMTAAGFKRAFGRDASGTMERFIKGLGKIPKEQRLAVVQKVFGKGTGLTRLIIGLADSFDRNLNPALDGSRKAWADGTAAQAEYEKRVQTTAAQLDIFKNNVNDAAITVGSALLPQLVELSKEGTGWITEHQDEIKGFGEGLARNIRDAVEYARSLDWDAIGKALGAGADAAKTIVDVFTNMPPELQQLLVGGFVANKVTGGVVTDVLGGMGGALFKGLALKTLGIQAAVVNVNGGMVNGGGIPGAAGGGGTLANSLLKGALGIGLGVGGSWVLGQSTQLGATPEGAAAGMLGGGGMIAGGALIAGPIGAMAGSVLAVAQTLQQQRDASSTQAAAINANLQAGIAVKTPAELQTALAGVEQGIHDIESNPLNVLVAGSALDQLKAMREQLKTQLAGSGATTPGTIEYDPTGFKNSASGAPIIKGLGDTHSEQLATTRAVDAVKGKQAESLVAFRAGERATQTAGNTTASASRMAGATSAMATFSSASRIVSALSGIRPTVNVTVTGVPGASVRYGSPTGSAGGGGQTRRPG
jgi:TP901 family phage tail tape measure protein